MNRAPVALFALLCTLASSMVAAGVANDRPASAGKSLRIGKNSDLRTVSFVGSPQEKWLTQSSWKAIDVQRSIALPTKKLPVQVPEKNKMVAAVIITIEQPQAAVVKAAPKQVAKPVAKTQAVKVDAAQIETAKSTIVAITKVVAALKPAAVQPRVTASAAATYAPKSNIGPALYSNTITLADLHLCRPAVATTSGVINTQPIAISSGKNNTIALGGEKLQVAYGSLNLISVGGSSFIPSPYTTENAASILPKKVLGTVKPAIKAAVPTQTTLKSTGVDIAWIRAVAIRTSNNVIGQLGGQVNRVATNYLGNFQGSIIPEWVPVLGNSTDAPSIQSAQRKSTDTTAVKK